jgi:hypothetical protein
MTACQIVFCLGRVSGRNWPERCAAAECRCHSIYRRTCRAPRASPPGFRATQPLGRPQRGVRHCLGPWGGEISDQVPPPSLPAIAERSLRAGRARHLSRPREVVRGGLSGRGGWRADRRDCRTSVGLSCASRGEGGAGGECPPSETSAARRVRASLELVPRGQVRSAPRRTRRPTPASLARAPAVAPQTSAGERLHSDGSGCPGVMSDPVEAWREGQGTVVPQTGLV